MKLSLKPALFAIGAAAFVAILCISYGYFIEPNRLVVNKSELKIKGWNAAFDGFKIVAIADIHGGSNGASDENLRRVVKDTNAQKPDIVVLLGDYVSPQSDSAAGPERRLNMPMSTVADNLEGLTAKYGVFAVLGNHDGFYDDDTVSAELRRIGCTVLRNEIAVIEKDGQKIRILGLNDHMKLASWNSFDSDVRKVMADSGQAGDFIVLEHSPDIFQVLNYYKMLGPDFKLMIAGHTHGGQVWLPIIGAPIVPSSFGQKYNRGHIREDGADMFVTTGIGTSIMPFRFLMPPEIAVLTIRPE
jgi:predicted MPP superfamily phosphohydrolase